MIKGAIFTLGILVLLGGSVGAVLMFLAALGNPAPSASSDGATTFWCLVGVGGIGIAMIVGACFIK